MSNQTTSIQQSASVPSSCDGSILSCDTNKHLPWRPTLDEKTSLPTRTKFYSAILWKSNRLRNTLRPGDIRYEEFFNENDNEMNDAKIVSIRQGQLQNSCDYTGQYLYSEDTLKYIRVGVQKWTLLPQGDEFQKESKEALNDYLNGFSSLLHHRLKSNVVRSIVNREYQLRHNDGNNNSDDGTLIFCGSKGNAESPLKMVQFSNLYEVCNGSWDDTNPPPTKISWIHQFKNESEYHVTMDLLKVFYCIKKDDYPLPKLKTTGAVVARPSTNTNNTGNGTNQTNANSGNTRTVQWSNHFSTRVFTVDDENDKENSIQRPLQKPQRSRSPPSTHHDETPEFKTILIGEPGVGKRSFLRHFSPLVTKYVSCIGVAVTPVHLLTNRGPVVLNVWTPEESVELTACCVQAQAAIIMFDVMNRESFRASVEMLKEVFKYTTDIPIVIVGNKADTGKPQEAPYRRKKNVQYYDISARYGYNTERPFLWLLRKLSGDNGLHFIESEFPKPRREAKIAAASFADDDDGDDL